MNKKINSIFFENLIKNYNIELDTKLRGFNDNLDYLKYWVPGTNDYSSAINLIDALYENNNLEFDLIFNKNDQKVELAKKLEKLNKKIGSIKIFIEEKVVKTSFVIDRTLYESQRSNHIKKIKIKTRKIESVNKIDLNEEEYDILPDYKINIEKQKIKNVKEINPRNQDTVVLEKEVFNFILNLKINKKTNKIVEAWHNSHDQDYRSKLIDLFCDFLKNKGIQECAEHSVIYLENYLRPISIATKVQGILLPGKAGKDFFTLEKSIRKIFKDYQKKMNYVEKINKEYFNSNKEWLSKDNNEKIKLITNFLNLNVYPELNISSEDLKVVKIESENLIILDISEKFKKLNNTSKNLLINIESNIKKNIDTRLEIFILPRKDGNKLRLTNAPKSTN